MAQLDSKVASIVDRATRDDDSDEDGLIASLEDDSELDAFREQRLQQLHAEYSRAQQLKASEHGTYTEIKDEKALMNITTSTKLCVVHFFKPDFNRCRVMDTHLESLATSHYEARILKINVDNCPFLVTRLGIQVLPCVIAFIDGVGADRIIGFEGLGRTSESFTTRDLEARLIRANVLARNKVNDEDERRRVQKSKAKQQEDEEDDWED
ncbi:thioredoxin-like protein [Cucurbitaria berberidis CBS 394.84]|uniref:Thioredoxin-like protein n=1 Tax=Cucurbitaria berberidis CBS 394.84 TaxID=1168544 RepID=A0A9P4GSF9_9PLEO|nr:thioredoxin-like protein [Cucurbitaria berberidis CBS 394.84]KAF1850967.1 thioredoxin-like protein [Cucurbitaria berberidis CBS 394.84]